MHRVFLSIATPPAPPDPPCRSPDPAGTAHLSHPQVAAPPTPRPPRLARRTLPPSSSQAGSWWISDFYLFCPYFPPLFCSFLAVTLLPSITGKSPAFPCPLSPQRCQGGAGTPPVCKTPVGPQNATRPAGTVPQCPPSPGEQQRDPPGHTASRFVPKFSFLDAIPTLSQVLASPLNPGRVKTPPAPAPGTARPCSPKKEKPESSGHRSIYRFLFNIKKVPIKNSFLNNTKRPFEGQSGGRGGSRGGPLWPGQHKHCTGQLGGWGKEGVF